MVENTGNSFPGLTKATTVSIEVRIHGVAWWFQWKIWNIVADLLQRYQGNKCMNSTGKLYDAAQQI